MPYGGTKNLRCGVLIDSIAKSVSNTVKDANKVKCEGCDDYEAATMHCVDCGQNFGPQCLSTHRKMKVLTSHQLLPLHDVLKGKVEVKRVPRCQKHPMFELNTFCNACSVVACPQCAVSDHLGHTFRPLEMVSGDLRDRIIDMAFTISQREQMARKTISVLMMQFSPLNIPDQRRKKFNLSRPCCTLLWMPVLRSWCQTFTKRATS